MENNRLSQDLAFEKAIRPLTVAEQAAERVKFNKMEFENMWKFSEYVRELSDDVEKRRDKSAQATDEEVAEAMKYMPRI